MLKKFRDKPTTLLTASELKTPKGKFVYFLFCLVVLIVCIITVLPMLWTICTAFKETQEIYSEFNFFPKNISWEIIVNRITSAAKELKFGGTIMSTLILSIGSLFFAITIPGLAGYVLSKLKPRGTKVIFALIVWTMMMPGQVRLVPVYISWLHFPFAYDWGGINLLDTYWPMWLGAASGAFSMVMFKNCFDSVSNSLVEAARLDGSTDLGIFVKIMLPLSMPIVIFQGINTMMGAWSDFFSPLLYFNKTESLPLAVYKMQMRNDVQLNDKFMGMLFGTIPTFIIFVLFQKQIMGGINVGGVKG